MSDAPLPPREPAQRLPQTPAPTSAPTKTELGVALGQMAGVLLSSQTLDTAVGLVSTLAARTIPGTAGAGVTVIDERGKRTTSASDPMVERADALQYQLDTGPCLSAWRDHVPVRIDDTRADPRWPRWTAAVLEVGVRSVLSAPMLAGGDAIGAIKVYSTLPGAFDEHAEQVLILFAQQAAVLLANTQTTSRDRQLSAQLAQALTERDLIGQAKGVLIARGAADSQTAFGMLVAAAEGSRTPVHDVARQLVDSVTGQRADRPPPDGRA